MDTRSKILNAHRSWPEFARPLAVVSGYFDILRAEHVRELQAARDTVGAATLLIIVNPRDGELLPLGARAEMVAALRAVDYVACAIAIDAVHPDSVVNLEESDEQRLRELRISAAGPSGSAANK